MESAMKPFSGYASAMNTFLHPVEINLVRTSAVESDSSSMVLMTLLICPQALTAANVYIMMISSVMGFARYLKPWRDTVF